MKTIPIQAAALLALGLTLAALPAVAADPSPATAESENAYQQAYLARAREVADQNRYLVKADLAWTPGNKVDPPANMEPRMVHPEQIQEALQELQSQGYCVERPSYCPNCQLRPNAKDCKRPNILIFLVDDMGWGDFGVYGGGEAVGAATPNVDRLAQEGLLLTSTYAQPTCSPTRATIHTGQLPIHHGVFRPPMYGDPGGIGGSITLPMLLQQAGYFTQGVGKWHLGENEASQPQNVGYDDYYGFLSVSDMYTEWRDHYFNPEVVYDPQRTAYMKHLGFNHYLVHSTHDPKTGASTCESLREITIPSDAVEPGTDFEASPPPCKPNRDLGKVSISELDQEWVRYSEQFIRSRQGQKQPWFLYHGTRGCHFDNYPNKAHQAVSYARTSYTDCQVEMDEILGRLILALKETGQDRDTLVFFTSDNGPEQEVDPHGRTPFRGGKGDTWEGGMRVPGIAWWPGMIEPGRRSDGLFDLADLFTTGLALAGVNIEDEIGMRMQNRYIYGIDQTSFLLAKNGESNRRSELYWLQLHFNAVRMDEFKAHVGVSLPTGLHEGNIGGLSGATTNMSYMWLFNLHQDPQEQNNLSIRHLWNQPLFTNEFKRFKTVLKYYPPNLSGEQSTQDPSGEPMDPSGE